MAAVCALLAAFLPSAALAGASVSPEAVADWKGEFDKRTIYYDINADKALLEVFEGEAFDGAVVESYAMDNSHLRSGAAVLRHADGSLHAYILAMGEDESWYIAEQTGELPQLDGVNRIRVKCWFGPEIDIVFCKEERQLCSFDFEGEPGNMTLSFFSCSGSEIIRAYVPTLRELRFDDVSWHSQIGDIKDLDEVWIGADAEVVYHHSVFEAETYVSKDAFAIPFQDADLGALLERIGAATQAGIKDVDEDATLQAVAEREEKGVPADLPILPESRNIPYLLPEPVLAAFAPGQRFDVYTGPGSDYLREEDGHASVSTDDWILVFGEENGWLMIAYRVSKEVIRFGWIEATQEQAGVSVPALSWANETNVIAANMTNEPLINLPTSMSWRKQEYAPVTMLGSLCDVWAYVQTTAQDGKPTRGFVHRFDFTYVPPDDTMAIVAIPEGASVALYDAPDGREIGRLYPWAFVYVKEEKDGMLHVICYKVDGGLPSFDLSVQGWIDKSAVTLDEDEILLYDDEVGLLTRRVVMTADEDATPEDIAQRGNAVALALVAELGDEAYLFAATYDVEGMTLPRSRLKETTRGVLCMPEGERGDLVNLYWHTQGADAVGSETSDFIQYHVGTPVDVLLRVDGAALICVHTRWELNGTYWVDGRNVIEVE